MGLDQYAYAGFAGQRNEYYNQEGEYDPITQEWTSSGPTTKPRELAYWRKHPNLHGWMEQLWFEKGMPGTGNKDTPFNCVELELTWEDIDRLEADIKNGHVAGLETTGFFFGNSSDSIYHEQDLQFCIDAKAEIFLGFRVFYNSSW